MFTRFLWEPSEILPKVIQIYLLWAFLLYFSVFLWKRQIIFTHFYVQSTDFAVFLLFLDTMYKMHKIRRLFSTSPLSAKNARTAVFQPVRALLRALRNVARGKTINVAFDKTDVFLRFFTPHRGHPPCSVRELFRRKAPCRRGKQRRTVRVPP